MSINEDTSFIEYPVDQPTQDFVTNFDTIGGTTDVVLVTVDGVLTDTPESSYTVQQINHTTLRVTPEVQTGSVVRLYRVTNIDDMMHVFTAGAKFIARNMDSNFKQIRHAQQEVRDYSDDTRSAVTTTLGNYEARIEGVEATTEAHTTRLNNEITARKQADTLEAQARVQGDLDSRRYAEDLLAMGNIWDGISARSVWDNELGLNQAQINAQLTSTVESISDLIAINNPKDGQVVYVKSYYAGLNKGGDLFEYKATRQLENDGGNIINGWVRQVSPSYLNVMNFGAKGDGVTNDYPAFKAVSDYVKNTDLKGYTIHLPTPDDCYAVSGQTFEAGKGFINNSVLDVTFDTMQDKLILLHSDNAKIKQMSGQYFGAFNKNTKEVLNTVTPFYPGSGANYDAVKDIVSIAGLECTIIFANIKSLIMTGKLDLDGNRDGMIIGGKRGDTGWQVGAYGIRIVLVKQFDIANINSHHSCLDGIYIAGWNDKVNPDVKLPDVFGVARNLNSQYNSRQGMSLTGGQNISFYDCTFDNTALPEFSVQSLPMSCVDIEAEVSPIRNISFYNSFFGNAGGWSMVADSGNTGGVNFYNCQFVNSLGAALWVSKPKFKFVDCYVNGRVEKNFGTEVDSERTIYQGCTFTDDPVINPQFVGEPYLFEAANANPKLIDCTFNLYKSGFTYSYGTPAKYPMLFKNVIVNAYVAGGAAIAGVGTIRLRDYRPQESRTDTYLTFGGGNKITVAVDKTDDIGNKLVPISAYATVYANTDDPDYIVFAPQPKKLDAVAESTLTDDTATKLNALLAQLKAKGYM